jgi:hypothetical protein
MPGCNDRFPVLCVEAAAARSVAASVSVVDSPQVVTSPFPLSITTTTDPVVIGTVPAIPGEGPIVTTSPPPPTAAPVSPVATDVHVGTKGFVNLGSTCHTGAVIQALSHSSRFVEAILALEETKPGSISDSITESLRDLIRLQVTPSNEPHIHIGGLFDLLHQYKPAAFRIGHSSDAVESFAQLIDALPDSIQDLFLSETVWGADVHRPIPLMSPVNDLESLLTAGGPAPFHPPVLVLSLNRLSYDNKGKTVMLDSLVEYPDQLNWDGTLYRLVSIVRHHPGHFTTDFLQAGQWYRGDDSKVTLIGPVPPHNGRNEYMLVYEQ